MTKLAFIFLILVPACVLEPKDTSYQPTLEDDSLAGFDGPWSLETRNIDGQVSGYLKVERSDGRCFVLSHATTITLDGVPGTIDHGGFDAGDGEYPHNDDHCLSPTVTFVVTTPSAHSTIIASDDLTRWTIALDDAFADHRFTLLSPTNEPARPGDEIAVELQPAATISNVHMRLSTSAGTSYACADRSCQTPLAIEGALAHFTLGPVSTSETGKLVASAWVPVAIPRCDIPNGCAATNQTFTDIDVAVAPLNAQ